MTSASIAVPPAATRRDGGHELLDVAHPVLEQVADAAGLVCEQLAGVQLLDVLRQHEDREPGHLLACGGGGDQPLVGERRWWRGPPPWCCWATTSGRTCSLMPAGRRSSSCCSWSGR